MNWALEYIGKCIRQHKQPCPHMETPTRRMWSWVCAIILNTVTDTMYCIDYIPPEWVSSMYMILRTFDADDVTHTKYLYNVKFMFLSHIPRSTIVLMLSNYLQITSKKYIMPQRNNIWILSTLTANIRVTDVDHVEVLMKNKALLVMPKSNTLSYHYTLQHLVFDRLEENIKATIYW